MKKRTALLTAICAGFLMSGCGRVDLTMATVDGTEISQSAATSQQSGNSAQTEQTPHNGNSAQTSSGASTEESSSQAVYGENFVGCTAAVCYDVTNAEVLYSKNETARIYPASITKLMTALTAIEYTSSDYVYSVGSELDLVALDSTRAWLSYGESYTRDAILAALLAPSGNDAAYTIAVNVARKVYGNDLSDSEAVTRFGELMTQYAEYIGCEDTNFTVPDGYHDDNHYTTVSDMLKISLAAAESDVICDITSQAVAVVYDEDGYVHSWENGNLLLDNEAVPYTAYGLKTGYTDEAGFCFAGLARSEGKTVLTLTFGCDVKDRYADTLKLMALGFGTYSSDAEYTTDNIKSE